MEFLYFLAGLRNDVLDVIISLLTNLGGEVICIAAICILFYCIDKKTAYKLCLTYFVSGLAVQALKITFRVSRPWVKDPNFHAVESAIEGASGYSFPSGHTQSGTALYMGLALHLKKIWGYIAGLALSLFVMFTRMYLGVHTPMDVLVSFGVTLIIAFIVNLVYDRFVGTKRANIIIFALIEIISFALIGYSIYIVASGKSTMELAMDGFKAAGAGIGFGLGWLVETTWVNFDPKAVKNIWGHILKLVIGLGVAMLIKSLIKLINPDSCFINIIRYVLTTFWLIGIFPMLIKKFSKSK